MVRALSRKQALLKWKLASVNRVYDLDGHWHSAFVVIELTIQYLVTLSLLRQFTCNHIIQLNLSQLLKHSVPSRLEWQKAQETTKEKNLLNFENCYSRGEMELFLYICVSAPLMSPMHVCTLFSPFQRRDARSKCSLNRGMRWNAVEWETIGRLSEESNKVEKMPIIMIIDPLFSGPFFLFVHVQFGGVDFIIATRMSFERLFELHCCNQC